MNAVLILGVAAKKDHCWLHISSKMLPIKRIISYKETAPVSTPGRTFIKITKWKIG